MPIAEDQIVVVGLPALSPSEAFYLPELFKGLGTTLRHMAGSVGKVLDAALTEAEKDLIFWDNAEHILAAQSEIPLSSKREGVAP